MTEAYNTNQAALAELDPDEAFEDSGAYELNGTPLYFGLRHYYAVMTIGSMASISDIERVFLVLWVATHDETEVKGIRKTWRNNPDAIYSAIEEVPFKYNVHGDKAVKQISELVNKMWDDIEASRDQIDEDEEKNSSGGSPGK